MNRMLKKGLVGVIVVFALHMGMIWYTVTRHDRAAVKHEYPWLTRMKSEASTNIASQRMSAVERETRFGGFQLVNDNATYAYAGYYDDRDDVHVKVIVMAPKGIEYNFTCDVSYADGSVLNGEGYVRYHFSRAMPWTVNDTYQSGHIICPVPGMKGRPTHLLLSQIGEPRPKTNISVFPPSKTKNNITRCVREFDLNYSNVTQLVWNIELLRIFGVDKFIFYLWSQTEKVLEILRSYEADGIIQLRNLTINQPGTEIQKFIKYHIVWGQILAYHDCLFSEMFSAKYIIFHDVDEAIIPRKHKTLVELGDDLFQVKDKQQQIGSLRFKNTFFPLEQDTTNIDYPEKHLALQYNIAPLLFTGHKPSSHYGIRPKPMVIPKSVDEMFIHYVEKSKPGWREKYVDSRIAKMHHYRFIPSVEYALNVSDRSDQIMLGYSQRLVSAVQERFQRAHIIP